MLSLSLADFRELARKWALDGQRAPALGATPNELVRQGYEAWLKGQDGRRSQQEFEKLIKDRCPDAHIASSYRKFKGIIRPKPDELRAILTVLLDESEGRELEVACDLAEKLARRVDEDHSELLDDPAAAWMFVNAGPVILGPDDRARGRTFRELMGRRLQEAKEAQRKSNGAWPVPLTLWVIDASEIETQSDDAYYARNGVVTLASAIMAALGTRLPPPIGKVTLQFELDDAQVIPQRIRVGLNEGDNIPEAPEPDLRSDFIASSVVCLLGLRHRGRRRRSILRFLGDGEPETFFIRALAPGTLLTASNLAKDDFKDPDDRQKVLKHLAMRGVCLGTKVRLESLDAIVRNLEQPARSIDWALTEQLRVVQSVFFFEPDEHEVRDIPLKNVVAGESVRTAIWLLMAGAAAALRVQEKGALAETTLGREVLDLLAQNDVMIMTVQDFLRFDKWYRFGPLEEEQTSQERDT